MIGKGLVELRGPGYAFGFAEVPSQIIRVVRWWKFLVEHSSLTGGFERKFEALGVPPTKVARTSRVWAFLELGISC